jgi:NADH:ubiquinone oxidoreductase subunit H
MRTLIALIATILITPVALLCKAMLMWTERKQSKIEQYEDDL